MSGVTQALGKAAAAPQTARERLNRALVPVAWVLGAVGAVALLLCGVLYLLPEDRWPEALDEDAYPVYVTVSLAGSSLLGWSGMQHGLARLRRLVGWQVGGWSFVLLPLVCAVLSLLGAQEVVDMSQWPGAPWVGRFCRWYPPVLVSAALLAFVVVEARPDEGDQRRRVRPVRGAGALLLVLPYALLIALLVIGIEPPPATEELVGADVGETVQESMEDTTYALGSWAIVLQVVLAYFVGSSSAS